MISSALRRTVPPVTPDADLMTKIDGLTELVHLFHRVGFRRTSLSSDRLHRELACSRQRQDQFDDKLVKLAKTSECLYQTFSDMQARIHRLEESRDDVGLLPDVKRHEAQIRDMQARIHYLDESRGYMDLPPDVKRHDAQIRDMHARIRLLDARVCQIHQAQAPPALTCALRV